MSKERDWHLLTCEVPSPSDCPWWSLPQVVFMRQVTSMHSGQSLLSAVEPPFPWVWLTHWDGVMTALWSFHLRYF